jgi:hypothetical protein
MVGERRVERAPRRAAIVAAASAWPSSQPCSVARTQQRDRPRSTETGHRAAEALCGLDRARGPTSDRSLATARTRRPQRRVHGD